MYCKFYNMHQWTPYELQLHHLEALLVPAWFMEGGGHSSHMQWNYVHFFLQENIVTVPNLLSLGRIVLSPVLGYLVISSNFSVALGLFAVAGLSDMVSIWQCNMSSDYWHAVYVGWWIYCEKLQRAVLNAGFSSWSFGWQVPSFYFVHYTCSHQVTSKWILIIIITEAVLIFLFL